MPPKKKVEPDTFQDDSKPEQDQKAAHESDAQVSGFGDTIDTTVEGKSEGEMKALRDDAGLNQQPGHNATLLAWEQSPAGEEFKDGEDDRQKEEEEAAEAQSEEKDEAAVAYTEAVEGK